MTAPLGDRTIVQGQGAYFGSRRSQVQSLAFLGRTGKDPPSKTWEGAGRQCRSGVSNLVPIVSQTVFMVSAED